MDEHEERVDAEFAKMVFFEILPEGDKDAVLLLQKEIMRGLDALDSPLLREVVNEDTALLFSILGYPALFTAYNNRVLGRAPFTD